MFNKILLPSDGSEAALRTAREVGAQFTSGLETFVTVLVVVLPLETEHTDFDIEFVDAHNANVRRQAERVMEKTIRILAEFGTPHAGKILEGSPVSAVIAREAEAGGYDLIALSSRGLAAQKDNLHYTGSVTQHVIRRVRIPVLVFPVAE